MLHRLTVPATLFGDIAQLLPKTAVNLKLDLVTMAYDPKNCIQKVRPNPDIADFVKGSDVKALSARPGEVNLIEKTMSQIRLDELKQLESFMAPCKAATLVRELAHQIIRIAIGKPMSDAFYTKKITGILDADKVQAIVRDWKLAVQKKHNPPAESQWQRIELLDSAAPAEEVVMVIPEGSTAEYEELIQAGFLVGKEVILKKRRTGTGENDIKKDVPALAVGIITEVPTDSSKRVVVNFELCSKPGSSKSKPTAGGVVTCRLCVDDIELAATSELRPAEAKPKAQEGKPGAKIFQQFPWLKTQEGKEQEQEGVVPTIVAKWDNLVVTAEEEKAGEIKAKVALLMQVFKTPLTSKELMVVRRGKSVEVWTLVPFKKNALAIAPWTTEIKDRYWTLGRSCLLQLDGMNSNKKLWAIDGRLQGKLPRDDAPDDKPVSIFWLIERTIVSKEANLVQEHATSSINITVQLTTGSKRKFHRTSDDTESTNVGMPYLVNPKDIAAHTRLIAMDDLNLHKAAAKTDAISKK